ncbi:hypothetical protein CAPTEDRAFT_208881 [Capitella teleta]|uniref:Uncharacterized protein n=1 Tax=Capitella teleta TaxID=283909 RepID=R7UPX9_CAPTE|nr:hypothetical protein CAPTEDRAFT_208881 [Capitella teleta]|eukprot:ELU08158.1 hypothetical protein CAPTEDRAFT_208881 [Capitella teleta]
MWQWAVATISVGCVSSICCILVYVLRTSGKEKKTLEEDLTEEEVPAAPEAFPKFKTLHFADGGTLQALNDPESQIHPLLPYKERTESKHFFKKVKEGFEKSHEKEKKSIGQRSNSEAEGCMAHLSRLELGKHQT